MLGGPTTAVHTPASTSRARTSVDVMTDSARSPRPPSLPARREVTRWFLHFTPIGEVSGGGSSGLAAPPNPSHTHPFNGHFSGTTRVSRYQKGKTNLDFSEARDSEWHWRLLGRMQVFTSLHADYHASTLPLILQAGCPSCRPTNSIKALKG